MRKIIFICFTICLVSVFAFAQNQPFEVFDNAVKTERGGFSGNKENLSKIFNEERIRLGENFETELWKYLGSDAEKHYWIGIFLQSKSYLHGNQALPELALKIWQNGLELLEDRQDEESLGNKFKILVLSAVLAEKLGKSDLAFTHKKESEKITASGFDTKIYFPAMREYESCIYKNIGSDRYVCKEELEKSKELIISGGMIASKAIFLPQPIYPKEAKEKKILGRVNVIVLVDYNGSVISAEAVSGQKELFEAAVQAAKEARFVPVMVSGKPAKLRGVLVYNFVL